MSLLLPWHLISETVLRLPLNMDSCRKDLEDSEIVFSVDENKGYQHSHSNTSSDSLIFKVLETYV